MPQFEPWILDAARDRGVISDKQADALASVLTEETIRAGAAELSVVLHRAVDGAIIDRPAADAIRGLVEAEVRRAAGQAAPIPPEVLRASERFGPFVLVEKIGEGGMGAVWKAWQEGLGRWVAIKFVKGGAVEDLARFVREAQTAARITHPHVVPIYEAGEKDGTHYIAMEFVEGETLDRLRLDERRALEVLRDAARAIQHAHELGVIHRDIKPQNLILTAKEHVYVMDFGLAKSMKAPSGLSMTGTIVGTPEYMAPEQAQGDVNRLDERTDVWGLGATLYEMLTGQPPFDGENQLEVLRKVTDEDPAPPRRFNPKVDRDLQTIVLKCLEKDPARRYASAKDLADDAERCLKGEPIAARPAGAWTKLVKRVRRNPAPYASAAVVVVLLAAFGVHLTWSRWSRESVRRDAVGRAEAAVSRGEWTAALAAADAGLRGAPADATLLALQHRAQAGQSVERSREALARSREIEGGLPGLEARAAELEAQVPSSAPPSAKRELWEAQSRLQAARDGAALERERAVQLALAALELDGGFEEARRQIAEIRWEDYERAERTGDRARLQVLRPQVERYGGEEYRARIESPGVVAVVVDPPDAEVFLFRYEVHEKRMMPVPCSASGRVGESRWPDADPLAMDAGDAEKARVRDGTAYPLEAGDFNRVGLPLTLAPGSYLLMIRREGAAPVRYPVLVRRGGRWEGSVALDAEGPRGFVRVPAGPYVAGGDPEAFDMLGEGRPAHEVQVDEFWISRFAVTCGEYLEFLNDREFHPLGSAIDHSPRRSAAEHYWRTRGDEVVPQPPFEEDWPVFLVSGRDAEEYARWRTERHGQGRWTFDLPTEEEWEKAARGVDGRSFPWGDEFDPAFCAMTDSRAIPEGQTRQPEPIGLFPADESPYGVRDMGGTIGAWTRTVVREVQWICKGGAWGTPSNHCRSGTRSSNPPDMTGGSAGIRLVARRN